MQGFTRDGMEKVESEGMQAEATTGVIAIAVFDVATNGMP